MKKIIFSSFVVLSCILISAYTMHDEINFDTAVNELIEGQYLKKFMIKKTLNSYGHTSWQLAENTEILKTMARKFNEANTPQPVLGTSERSKYNSAVNTVKNLVASFPNNIQALLKQPSLLFSRYTKKVWNNLYNGDAQLIDEDNTQSIEEINSLKIMFFFHLIDLLAMTFESESYETMWYIKQLLGIAWNYPLSMRLACIESRAKDFESKNMVNGKIEYSIILNEVQQIIDKDPQAANLLFLPLEQTNEFDPAIIEIMKVNGYKDLAQFIESKNILKLKHIEHRNYYDQELVHEQSESSDDLQEAGFNVWLWCSIL